MKIKFVTDSVADIPPDLAAKWDIRVVPCFVNYGGRSYADDGVELVREDYYNELSSMRDHPTTSAMPPEMAREQIDAAIAEADHVILITTPAKLSGIHNAFRLGAEHLPPENYTLIDSGQISVGMGWQVLAGVEEAARSGDLARTLATVHAMRKAQRIYAIVGSLESLRRSGRVGWAQASIGTLLNIKPVVEMRDGEANPVTRVRTFNRALEKLAELARTQAPFDQLGIVHINNPEGAEAVRAMLADILPDTIITGLINPAVGTHIGPGSVGVGTVSKGWNDAIST
ncbi:MAG: DegV family protein [Chloroflexota bacterium]